MSIFCVFFCEGRGLAIQWRSKVMPGPGARLLYRAPPVLKEILEKKLRVYIFNEIEIPLFYILNLVYISSSLSQYHECNVYNREFVFLA
jgi:hypothetical protein